MCRPAALGLAFLVSLTAAVAQAQVPGMEVQAEPITPGPELPQFADRGTPGESVVELADFMCANLADAGSIPDWAQVRAADGSLRRLSAADTFVLLARTIYLWQSIGYLPSSVPVAPDQLRPPVLDPEDVPASDVDLSRGRQIPTDPFLAQCAATVQWVDRLHVVPTAVWVEGERLSAAEYLAGMAISLQHAYYEGELQPYLFLPRYAPPQTWARTASRSSAGAQARQAERPQPEPVPQAVAGTPTPPLGAGLATPLRSATARVSLFPEAGAALGGTVDMIASYEGPPPRFVIFAVDGATGSIMNVPPYRYRWDTSVLALGTHVLRVTAFGEEDAVLADVIVAYDIVPPEPEEPEEEL